MLLDTKQMSMLYLLGQAGVAQLVEQLICNQPVGGSNPSASFLKPLLVKGFAILRLEPALRK
jgi:hypothetical protein